MDQQGYAGKIGFIHANRWIYDCFVRMLRLTPKDVVFIYNADQIKGQRFSYVCSYPHNPGFIPADLDEIECVLRRWNIKIETLPNLPLHMYRAVIVNGKMKFGDEPYAEPKI